MAGPQHAQRRVVGLATACALGAWLGACATYDGNPNPSGASDGGTSFGGSSSAAGGSGGSAPSSGGMSAVAGAGASATGGSGSSSGGAAHGGSSTSLGGAGGSSGSGGSVGLGGASGSTGLGGASGSTGRGGSSGSGVTGGSSGSGGAGGLSSAGMGGGGAGGATQQLLSQSKPATADSEETSKGNLAALGNDGSATTRWCAADGAGGHYWQVDLGQKYTLSKLQINWEKAAVYQFKVEGSLDGSTWSLVLDQTASTNSTANQSYSLPAAPSARWVRITTTTLPNTTTWASFFEFQVYGH